MVARKRQNQQDNFHKIKKRISRQANHLQDEMFHNGTLYSTIPKVKQLIT